MINIKNFFSEFAVVVLVVLVTAGCSGKAGPAEEVSQNATEPPEQTARFNPFDLPQDREIIPRLHPKTAPIFSTNSADTANADSLPLTAVRPAIVERPLNLGIDKLNNQTFRIQIGATELFGDARREKKIAEEVFDQPVYLDYEVPYYKLRVGSFADRRSAEQYLQKAKMAGYKTAWVVTVRVTVKEIAPLYDDTRLLDFEESSEDEND
ncbi:MAG: SPOR domain-containing protein [candidate division Zixibacteria bacterium]|nr:SPOR domain-containing protein [candidate division Zixibacteria bacterium]